MEIVHVMGMSCVGKRTLIGQLISGNVDLRNACGISGTCVGFFPGGADGDRHKSELHWRPVERLLVDADRDHLLNKWQNDFHHYIDDLARTRPEIKQRCVVLWRTVEDNIERVGQSDKHVRDWPNYKIHMPHALCVIRSKVQDVEGKGLQTLHFDVTGCPDGTIDLSRRLPGIPPWIASLNPV